ncbi:MAG: choice-of-anchor J domain-containing protein [Bacteroidales bacterium]|nr:choice-of-anchor J domain-containing protein [Bacteroidales bacterium]MDD3910678.1 choice-of-anchor J domain-containing protein [Bacteroidales bacterium]MDD4421098.1 choice-of-anchor J domain-containing protein [Bacteroidales bacterium]
MKKLIISIYLISTVAFLMSSCQKQDWTYKGPQYFEFSASENNQSTTSNIYQKENSKIGVDSICIQLVAHSTSNVTVNYEIVKQLYYLTDEDKYVESVPSGKSAALVDTVYSTATYGTDYTVEESGTSTFSASTMTGSITIPKDKYFGYIKINMKKKAGNNFYVVLKDSEDTKVNKPNSIFKYILSPDMIYYFKESFASEIPDTWTIIDKDGDGHIWNWYDGAATSDSYISGGVGAVKPENYLVSPAIAVGKTTDNAYLTFELAAGDSDYPEENYRVIISESPITLDNCRNATILRDWTALDSSYADFKTETIDITAYKGKTVYVGFVHGNCTDCYYIELKNVKVFGR